MKPLVLVGGLAISLAMTSFTQAPVAEKAPPKKGMPPHQLTASEKQQIEAKAGELSGLIRSLRSDLERADEFGDAGTNDFLTGLMEQHEKMAWMLRATLERG